MDMGACPGQIPMPCVPPALMVTATMVRAFRYRIYNPIVKVESSASMKFEKKI